jgi:anti-sigma B factor antagonist
MEGIHREVRPAGGQHALTSEVRLTPEDDMPDALLSSDSIAGRSDLLPPAFVCSWTDGGPDAAWVHAAGELDIAAVPQLVGILRMSQLRARLVVLDLRELEFIDSSGVHAIVSASIRARRLGGRLVLLRAPPHADRLFTLMASSDCLEIGDPDPVEPRHVAQAAGVGVTSRAGRACRV